MLKIKKRSQGVDIESGGIGEVMGSATGDSEHSVVSGGWAGTDDATSTAPSDLIGNPPTPEEDKSAYAIERDFAATLDKDDEEQTERQNKIDISIL